MLTPDLMNTACRLLQCRFNQECLNVHVDWTIHFPDIVVTAMYQHGNTVKTCDTKLSDDMGEYEVKEACDGMFRAIVADLTNKVVS